MAEFNAFVDNTPEGEYEQGVIREMLKEPRYQNMKESGTFQWRVSNWSEYIEHIETPTYGMRRPLGLLQIAEDEEVEISLSARVVKKKQP